jgi:hypothetical protein
MSGWIESELKARRAYPRDRVVAQENELRTLAAEVVILRRLDVVVNLSEFLGLIEQQTNVPKLQRRVRKLLESPEGYARALDDANRAVRAVRRQAAAVQKRVMENSQLDLFSLFMARARKAS